MASLWMLACFVIFLQGHVTGREYCLFSVKYEFSSRFYTENRTCEYGCCENNCCTQTQNVSTDNRQWKFIGMAVAAVLMLSLMTTITCCVYRRQNRGIRLLQNGPFDNMDNTIPVTLTNHI